MFPFAGAAIRRLNEAGMAVIVVTNQSGVARGYFPESLVQQVHERMQRELAAVGARLDGVYYCPHGSADNCECRKPKTGMIEPRGARTHILICRARSSLAIATPTWNWRFGRTAKAFLCAPDTAWAK